MRGHQLQHSRNLLRMEKRRNASTEGRTAHRFYAIDEEELLNLVGLDQQNAPGNNVKIAVLALGLASLGYPPAKIAGALHLEPADLHRRQQIPLIDRDRTAEKIEAEVIALLPETPELGRRGAVTA